MTDTTRGKRKYFAKRQAPASADRLLKAVVAAAEKRLDGDELPNRWIRSLEAQSRQLERFWHRPQFSATWADSMADDACVAAWNVAYRAGWRSGLDERKREKKADAVMAAVARDLA